MLTDPLLEGYRIVDSAGENNLVVRLIGGLGVAAHDHRPLPPELEREFADIDLVIGRKDGRALSDFLVGIGYEANQRFNSLHGAKRMLFYDKENQRQVDVFVSQFQMCHSLVLEQHLKTHPRSLTPEHLLLTKLQIVEINRKDLLDVLRILYMHWNVDLPNECPGFSIERLNEVLSHDWGWFTTVNDNLEKVKSFAPTVLSQEKADEVLKSTHDLQQRIESSPKSTKWKTRALVGRRKVWYEIPEEVNGRA